ncbi:polysaccharide biosynthesis/export family protein [Bradyrhizobium sp. SYSU BS000235]|uniref:polysaccharide biosynthesis/export family protein n=1 Tax=Bradyrhizobium sp. SYSU BS000235 TaxID=3411332 RepID=UPI003C767466
MRASRLPLIAVFLCAFAVSGCMRPAAPIASAYAAVDEPYRLDAGDRLRIVVYGQEGLTNTYTVDAGGAITMPLIGGVSARGLTPAELAAAVTARLKKNYLREPYVAAEVETYRPFFILGEVTAPGQYPYVPNMTVESAVAIAGGFTPRAQRDSMALTRTGGAGTQRATVPPATYLKPGDTIVIGERWF